MCLEKWKRQRTSRIVYEYVSLQRSSWRSQKMRENSDSREFDEVVNATAVANAKYRKQFSVRGRKRKWARERHCDLEEKRKTKCLELVFLSSHNLVTLNEQTLLCSLMESPSRCRSTNIKVEDLSRITDARLAVKYQPNFLPSIFFLGQPLELFNGQQLKLCETLWATRWQQSSYLQLWICLMPFCIWYSAVQASIWTSSDKGDDVPLFPGLLCINCTYTYHHLYVHQSTNILRTSFSNHRAMHLGFISRPPLSAVTATMTMTDIVISLSISEKKRRKKKWHLSSTWKLRVWDRRGEKSEINKSLLLGGNSFFTIRIKGLFHRFLDPTLLTSLALTQRINFRSN